MGDLDIVGAAAVDIIPIAPNFHTRLKAAALPAADRVGREAGERIGEAIGRNITVAIPNAIVNGGQAARTAATRQGDDNAGAFGRAFKRRLQVAFRSLPRPDVRLSTTGFDADLARVRARMEALSGRRIGVDVDAATALSQLEAIDAELARLGERSPNIQVRADIATARAEIAAMQRAVNDLDRDDVHTRVTVDTVGAMAALRTLSIALGGVAAIPVVAVGAAGLGSIASAALAAGAGVGAFALAAIPAVKGVTEAIQAKTAAEKEAARATDTGAAASTRGAQQALQMASAQQALSAAHRNAARAIASANRQIEDAERSVADAAQRAMEQRERAAQAVERAERSLADAKKSARDAETSLTQARADAARQLDDLNDKLIDGALSQRDATLRVQEAEDDLRIAREKNAAGLISDRDLERAQLSYDQAVQAQKEQSKSFTQLQKDAAEAKRAGVDGNADVKRAADQLADAQRNVRDQVQAVTDAQRDAARAQVESARTVAEAQRRLSDAVDNAANAQVQAADSIATAERGVQSARMSGADATTRAVTKTDEYRRALAKLRPEQRALFDSIAGSTGLKAAFSAWAASMSPAVLPLFTRSVNAATAALPGLSTLVRETAAGVDELQDAASRELKDPFWDRFKTGIEGTARPAVVGLGKAVGNIFKGAAGVVDAFLPHINSIADRMVSATGKFATWGTSLRGSPEFERFLQYAAESAPKVSRFFTAIADAMLQIGEALSPLSGPVLDVLSQMTEGIAFVADEAPWLVAGIWAVVVGLKAWKLAVFAVTAAQSAAATVTALLTTETLALNAAQRANVIGVIIVALVALVAGIIYAYRHWDWFRNFVNGVWQGIASVVKWAWETVLKPVFSFMQGFIRGVGDVMTWLWKNVFEPAWSAISTIVRYATAVIVTLVVAPIVIAVQLMGKWIGWLWSAAFKPTFQMIGNLAVAIWKNFLQPFFQGFWGQIKWVGDKFVWLYDKAIKPASGWIADRAKWMWEKGIKPFFRGFWDGIQWVGDKFKWLYDRSIGPIVGWIADAAKWLWNKGVKPHFDLLKTGIQLVGAAFEDAKKTIRAAWNSIASIAAKPVNWVVEMVYTKGIKAVWDKVADFVGLDPLPKAPKLLDAPERFAQGGRTRGGTPGVDSIPILAMADEFIIKRDSARKIGFGNLAFMNETGTIPRFAGGGIVGALGSAWDWTKDTIGGAVSKGVDWAKTAADLMAHPSKVWNQLMKPILANVREHLGVAGIGELLAEFPPKIVGGLKDAIVDAMNFGGGGGNIGGTIPTGQRKAVISQAMAHAHVPPPGTMAQWLAGMNTLITRESGWNPNAINLWDSNAAAGHPSQGLTQTIPSTWSAHVPNALRSRGILDPVGNVAASIRYIVSRYGNITNVQQANANMPPMGYAEGGRIVPTWFDDGGHLPPGLSLVANGTGKPEPVFTGSQWSDIRASKGGTTTLLADVRVFVGDREITDIVDTRIELHDEATASDINNGRWV
ncbi:transglycosylase SLT domain-containing protein [Streptomyces shenzhenensis]|uniref:transglycosylase SLT domain-containing protein n=1 Tax=Streptomyces shenzhenensis TaxID=943815 RepID=UPI0037F4275B